MSVSQTLVFLSLFSAVICTQMEKSHICVFDFGCLEGEGKEILHYESKCEC